MPLVAQGGSVSLRALYRNGAGQAAEADSVSMQLRNPAGVVTYGPFSIPPIVNEAGVGEYSYAFVAGVAEALGTWVAEWSGVVAGSPVLGYDYVELVLPGSVTPDDYSYDPVTVVGQMRLYIDDRDVSLVGSMIPYGERSAIFSDTELNVFLGAANGVVLYGAALALMTIASNRQLMVQSRRLGKTSLDFGGIRRDYVAQAEALRKQADQMGLGPLAPAIGFAEIAWTDFGLRQIILNTELRTYSAGLSQY